MNQIKKIITVICAATAVICLIALHKIKTTKKAEITIGILQTASHPALDAACQGFTQELKKELGTNVDFIIKNAQGSLINAHALAQSMLASGGDTIDAFFAIATPAAQALEALEKQKPILIAAVTDPHAAGIMRPNSNVTGTSDMINVAKEVALIPILLPNVKKVAILFSNGEINASTMAHKMITELTRIGLTPIPIAITNEMDLIPALDKALKCADALLTPTDNTIACAIQLVAQRARSAKKPLIVSDNLLVKQGALASRGVDYHESGKQAATIALQILIQGKKPADIPLLSGNSDTIVINPITAQHLGITVPDALKKQIKLVTSQEQAHQEQAHQKQVSQEQT